MIITALPLASAIRVESRLRPEQVNLEYANTTELEADITARIGKYAAVINKKIVDAEDTPDNQIIATEALFLRVEASLYGSAGYLNPAYWGRAQELKAESNELLKDLSVGVTDAALSSALVTPRTHGGTFDVFLA